MKILVLDNYDSFVYNLVHMIRELGHQADVYRNDKISVEQVAAYDKILLSPGPGIPSEAGIMLDLIKQYAPQKSILGICLGHQAIGEAFGGELYNLPEVLHGIASQNTVIVDDEGLFKNIPATFKIGHYHSWVVKKESLGKDLQITGLDLHEHIMALRHQNYDVRGLQFHPESILTEYGKVMIQNWLEGSN